MLERTRLGRVVKRVIDFGFWRTIYMSHPVTFNVTPFTKALFLLCVAAGRRARAFVGVQLLAAERPFFPLCVELVPSPSLPPRIQVQSSELEFRLLSQCVHLDTLRKGRFFHFIHLVGRSVVCVCVCVSGLRFCVCFNYRPCASRAPLGVRLKQEKT